MKMEASWSEKKKNTKNSKIKTNEQVPSAYHSVDEGKPKERKFKSRQPRNDSFKNRERSGF